MASLIDTNVLVYRYDQRNPEKQDVADKLLRRGIAKADLLIAHQAIVEFVAAVRRPITKAGRSLLTETEAVREAEDLMAEFEVLYPDAETLRLALRGMASYGLSWFDAHMWAYAERYGIEEIVSEDFQHDRLYGTVRARNPFETTAV